MQFEQIDQDALVQAYETGSPARRFYLDGESGTVVCVTEAVRGILQEIYDAVGDEATVGDTHLATNELRIAHAVEMDDERFVKVPFASEKERLQDADAFSRTVEPALQQLLWSALDAGDLVRFERVLGLESAELTRWLQFRHSLLAARLKQHLTQPT